MWPFLLSSLGLLLALYGGLGIRATSPNPPARLLSGSLDVQQLVGWDPEGRSLVFLAASAEGRTLLYRTAEEEGATPEPLLTQPLYEHPQQVVLSPDGQRLAFTAEEEGQNWLFVGRPGEPAERVALVGELKAPAPLAWSPEGSRLAFGRRAEQDYSLYVLSLEGGGTALDLHFQAPCQAVAWSPDGQKLAFINPQNGPPCLYVFSFTPPRLRLYQPVADLRLVWSPTSWHVAALGRRFNRPKIYLFDTRAVPLIRRLNPQGQAAEDDPPAWAPDGLRLAFAARSHPRARTHQVYLVALPELEPLYRLSRSGRDNHSPAWSPDGQWLVYVSERGRDVSGRERADLRFVRPDRPGRPKILAPYPFVTAPHWSPDGTQLAFLVSQEKGTALGVAEVQDFLASP